MTEGNAKTFFSIRTMVSWDYVLWCQNEHLLFHASLTHESSILPHLPIEAIGSTYPKYQKVYCLAYLSAGQWEALLSTPLLRRGLENRWLLRMKGIWNMMWGNGFFIHSLFIQRQLQWPQRWQFSRERTSWIRNSWNHLQKTRNGIIVERGKPDGMFFSPRHGKMTVLHIKRHAILTRPFPQFSAAHSNVSTVEPSSVAIVCRFYTGRCSGVLWCTLITLQMLRATFDIEQPLLSVAGLCAMWNSDFSSVLNCTEHLSRYRRLYMRMWWRGWQSYLTFSSWPIKTACFTTREKFWTLLNTSCPRTLCWWCRENNIH